MTFLVINIKTVSVLRGENRLSNSMESLQEKAKNISKKKQNLCTRKQRISIAILLSSWVKDRIICVDPG